MKNSDLAEEENQPGLVFIKEYNRVHSTNYQLANQQPDENDEADLIFTCEGLEMKVQITMAVKSEKEEAKISKDLKEKGEAWIIGDVPDEDIIIRAIQKKCSKKYAGSQGLILVVYTYRSVTLPRNFKLPEDYLNNVKESFNEIWYVNMRKHYAIRIYP